MIKLDDKDKEIIESLNKNGRISYSKLGNKVNLSASGVRKRVMRLEKEGLIKGYKAVLDHRKLQKDSHAFLKIRNEVDKIKTKLKEDKRIKKIYRISGETPIMIEGWFENNQELFKFIEELKESIEGEIKVDIALDEETIR